MIDQIDRFKATLLGLACGDALGKPTEFIRMGEIRSRFGPKGITDIEQTSGQYTDDTQMTIALAEGILDARDKHPSDRLRDADCGSPKWVMPHVAKRFVEWAFSSDNNRAPGTTCMAGCRALRKGADWKEAGVRDSKGCGSAMRSSPVGMVYDVHHTIEEMARASSIVTHGHQAAQDAAHVAALGVHLLLEGVAPEQAMAICWKQCCHDERITLLMSQVVELVGKTIDGEIEPHEVMTNEHLGESWTGDEAVASAWYCFLLAYKRSEGYVETARYGANTVGDSDSIAAIAGSFAGAFWGIGGDRGIPESWIERVENNEGLILLAERLYAMRQDLTEARW